MGNTCRECRYFHTTSEYKGAINGECRINPPRPVFPMVKSIWWCGKFKAVVTIPDNIKVNEIDIHCFLGN